MKSVVIRGTGKMKTTNKILRAAISTLLYVVVLSVAGIFGAWALKHMDARWYIALVIMAIFVMQYRSMK